MANMEENIVVLSAGAPRTVDLELLVAGDQVWMLEDSRRV